MADDLDLTETALREWVKRADIDAGEGPPDALNTAEREEQLLHFVHPPQGPALRVEKDFKKRCNASLRRGVSIGERSAPSRNLRSGKQIGLRMGRIGVHGYLARLFL